MLTRIDKALAAGVAAGGSVLALVGTGGGKYADYALIAAVLVGAGVGVITFLTPNKPPAA